MDALKREMARKRKALREAKKRAGNKEESSFLRAADLRQIEEEHQQAELEARSSSSSSRIEKKDKPLPSTTTDIIVDGNLSRHNDDVPKSKRVKINDDDSKILKPRDENDKQKSSTGKIFPPLELTRRLRLLGLPIRLFGERMDDKARQDRLNQAMEGRTKSLLGQSERREYQLEKGHRIRNPFLEKDDPEDDDDKATNKEHFPKVGHDSSGSTSIAKDHGSNASQMDENDQRQIQATSGDSSKQQSSNKKVSPIPWEGKDPHDQILDYFQGLLMEWERQLASRPDSVKHSMAGKRETKTARQCRDYIGPLFQACKTRQLDQSTLLQPLARITQYGRAGEFVQAHQAYMDVAIGRAAWPIGVTMVGIHARTGRAKIESANVAHVMNSELQRKYLTSIKRLLTFAQAQRDDVDPSKKVLS